ncbi:oligosaccharide flippase family protein [bacterium]|nr:oligosaccharide flippase family protein [bacterium]
MMSLQIKKKLIKITYKIHFWLFKQKMSQEMKSFTRNLGYVGTSTFLVTILMTIFQVIIGRKLGPSEYGKFSLLDSLSGLLYFVMTLGISTSIVYHLSLSKKESEKKTLAKTGFILLIINVSIIFLIFYFANPLILKIQHIDQKWVTLMFIYATIYTFHYFAKSLLRGYQKMKFYAIVDLFSGILTLTVALLLIFTYQIDNYQAPTIAKMTGFTSVALLGICFSKIWLGKMSINKAKRIISYGLISFLLWIFVGLLNSSDKLILNQILPSEKLGIYYAYMLGSSAIIYQAVMAFLINFFPTAVAAKSKKAILKKIELVFKKTWWAIILLGVFSTSTTLILFGSKYPLKLNYTLIMGINSLFFTFYQIYMWLINAQGTKAVFETTKSLFLGSIVQISLFRLMTTKFDIQGSFAAIALTNIFLYFLMRHKARKIYKL